MSPPRSLRTCWRRCAPLLCRSRAQDGDVVGHRGLPQPFYLFTHDDVDLSRVLVWELFAEPAGDVTDHLVGVEFCTHGGMIRDRDEQESAPTSPLSRLRAPPIGFSPCWWRSTLGRSSPRERRWRTSSEGPLDALGVDVSWRRFALLGLLAAPATVIAATLAVLATT